MGYRKVWMCAALALLAACAGKEPQMSPASTEAATELAHYQLEATLGSGSAVDAVVRLTLPAAVANAAPSFILGERFTVDPAPGVEGRDRGDERSFYLRFFHGGAAFVRASAG
jgi:hypothetical protein